MANKTLSDAPILAANGELTPEAEPKIQALAAEVAQLLEQAENPQAAAAEYARLFRQGLIDMVGAAAAGPTDMARATFMKAATTCWERRPGRDPVTGDLQPGATETDWSDRLPCTEPFGHDDDHRDAALRTWAHA